MPPSCVFDWNTFLSQWGLPGAIILGGGLFIYRKVWPTFEKFLDGIVLHLKAIADALALLIPAMQAHEANTKEVLKEIQDLANTHDRRTTTRRKPQ